MASALSAGNPQFWNGGKTGQESAVREIERLYAIVKRLQNVHVEQLARANHAEVLLEGLKVTAAQQTGQIVTGYGPDGHYVQR